jgi:hypothetical protein
MFIVSANEISGFSMSTYSSPSKQDGSYELVELEEPNELEELVEPKESVELSESIELQKISECCSWENLGLGWFFFSFLYIGTTLGLMYIFGIQFLIGDDITLHRKGSALLSLAICNTIWILIMVVIYCHKIRKKDTRNQLASMA